MLKVTPLLALAAVVGFGAAAEAQTTLKSVQDRGSLVCGVNQGLEGFGNKDDKGQWSGFDVDFCRALAAVIFNDPSKVQFVPLSARRGSMRSRPSRSMSCHATRPGRWGARAITPSRSRA